ncbi:MAG: PilZ domain-containing protein [Omnitrophica bacterium]|nr:PilZ domain-containing protein [Candidatus Omnitrophota bacterium]
MKGKRPEEKRRYVRIDLATKVNFRIKGKDKKETSLVPASAISNNISVEGICFRSEQQLPPGTKLELQVVLPSEKEPLILSGKVKWSHPTQGTGEDKGKFDVGVQLYIFGNSDENRYLRYVSERMMERLSQYLHL